jgi:subtilisin family serine protease/fibronectin type 3 domain-containing protein
MNKLKPITILSAKRLAASVLFAVGASVLTAQTPVDQAATPALDAQANNQAVAQAAPAVAHTLGQTIVEGELLVHFKESATDAEVEDAKGKGKLKVRKQLKTSKKAKKDRGVIHATTDLPVEDAIAELKKHPAVEFAEPNWVYTHQAASNDPYYNAGYLWGMCGDLTSPSTVWGSQAAEAWNAGSLGANTVFVGIIDEGVQVAHPDLAANMWSNPFDPVDGLDNDGNGYADDANGWNFYDYNNRVFDPAGDQHGTHVAGTIGARGGNGLGVAGVNWNVTMISGKFLGAQGGTTADAIEAIEYFTDLKTRHGINLVALNNSWGGGGYSQALHDAILRAAKAGILFVAAAGNGDAYGRGLNNDTYANYPSNYDTRFGTSTESAASYDAVIAVAAIDPYGGRAAFSNYGAKHVDLGAPGVSILSTLPTDGYGYSDGTSMATPHVTGAVALYASTHPQATAQNIKSAILGAVKPTPSLAGITVTGGRLDLSTIIGTLVSEPEPQPEPQPTAPLAPTGVTASAGTLRVTLNWAAVSNATSYVVKRASVSGGPYTTVASGVTATTFADTTNLIPGTTYFYVVAAVNATGTSPDSTQVSATPLPAAPAAPTGATATAAKAQVNGSTTVALNWNAVSGATTYKVKRGTSASGPFTVVANAVSANSYTENVTANGTTYYYVVSAVNSGGESANSTAASVRPTGPAPTGLTATAISRSQIRIAWADQSSNEAGFKVDYSLDGANWYYLGALGSNSTGATVSGLAANRFYYFRVRAYNGTVHTAYSNPASARTWQ